MSSVKRVDENRMHHVLACLLLCIFLCFVLCLAYKMRTEVINADTIDAAVDRILDELEDYTSPVIYFDGWEGLGASAVLRAVAQRLVVASEGPPAGRLKFGQIIHIDCSKWENVRMVQRAIAEQLVLPVEVMEMFDVQDEEDDFSGVGQGSRGLIKEVLKVMRRRIRELNRSFLVIFHNGGSEEIDLATFGFPLAKYLANKVLWTFQGRFRLYPRTKVDDALNKKSSAELTLFLSASPLEQHPQELIWSYLVDQEAAEVATMNAGGINRPSQVAECFLYRWKLCCMGHYLRMDYDLATHGSNYWICEGIIGPQQGKEGDNVHTDDDRSWQHADALQHEMRLDTDCYSIMHSLPSNLVGNAESMAAMPYWTSPAFGVLLLPAAVDMARAAVDMALHSHQKLVVLKLARCKFSLSWPPLHRCHNLRFLWFDHCQYHKEIRSTDAEAADGLKECFQRLWVLDVRYTCCDGILSAEMMHHMTQLRVLNVMGARDWDMGQMQGCLPNIWKLRITKSTILCSRSSSFSENDNLFSRMEKMELLDFSGNRNIGGMESLSATAANNRLLETVIIDEGCVGLEQISFRGCAKLKNVLLGGSFEKLENIDISGTAVKTLDLSAMESSQEKLVDKLIALGCDKLRVILWPPEQKWRKEEFYYLGKLHIDTTLEGRRSRAPTENDFPWYISLSDARLLQSLVPFESYLDEKCWIQLEVSSPGLADAGGSKEERTIITKSGIGSEQLVLVTEEQQAASVYEGVAVTLKQQTSEDDHGDAPTSSITQIWPCPRAPDMDHDDWYLYIQDRPTMPMRTSKLPVIAKGEEMISSTGSSSRSITVPDMICRNAKILHVHDSKSITRFSPLEVEGSTWGLLEWCRVERCPSLDSVFVCPAGGGQVFDFLETLWSSQLPRARCIWNMSQQSSFISSRSFVCLGLVHVDLCPRMTHVLPLWWSDHLPSLETLEIVWCGDLRAVFPIHLDNDDDDAQDQQQQQQTAVTFPELKHIHLHELPMLHGICGRGRMYAPNLESIKIRGCWSLARLPDVDDEKKVECDCEKEWWDRLKWDGKHLYKPTHPRHFKKMNLFRGSVLR